MLTFDIAVVSTFGLEAIVKNEILRLGYSISKVENGSIYLRGNFEVIAMLNLHLRCAERVFILMGQFEAKTFEELFQGVKSLAWSEILDEQSCFPVNAKSVKSKLFSLSDIQSISKKAMVENLKQNYQIEWFEEKGSKYPIHINFLNDVASVLIDTSGTGLHKRGYREVANEAPLKETLAAGLVYLAKWYGKKSLFDPFCGTGTILIEAAMIMRNIPPGLNRKALFESWVNVDSEMLKAVRKKGYEQITYDRDVEIIGSDIDARTIAIAKKNAELAGVDDCIEFKVLDVSKWDLELEGACMITNPPYGERLEEKSAVSRLHNHIKTIIDSKKVSSMGVLTSHEQFESDLGSKADKNRKLYNGNIKCYFYQYFMR